MARFFRPFRHQSVKVLDPTIMFLIYRPLRSEISNRSTTGFISSCSLDT